MRQYLESFLESRPTQYNGGTMPCLVQRGTTQQLIVHGKPFLMLGGELQNSQFSSARYMSDVWPRLKEANINTVFGAITWEQIEPVEGHYSFDELDQLVQDARQHGLKLVLLWFGTYKNALSTYTPTWVKLNSQRFPRAELQLNGQNVLTDAISAFSPESCEADAKAFSHFMSHLKELDEDHWTVIMVQVENETGLLGDSRDRSKLASQAWELPIPQVLLREIRRQWLQLSEGLRKNTMFVKETETSEQDITWAELSKISGELQVDELFMAYNFANYVEKVASAGKAAYSLPLYTNVWQNYCEDNPDNETGVSAIAAGGGKPGDYPSGGGVSDVLDIWKIFAPSLDLIAPDIYLNDYVATCKAYRHRGQALLIPEQRRDEYGARRIWSAFGSYNCIGTAPFGIDSLSSQENPFRRHYDLLNKVSSYLLMAQASEGNDQCKGFFFDELRPNGSDPSPAIILTFGDWILTVERAHVFGKPSAGSGMVIRVSASTFLLVGWGYQVSFIHRQHGAFVGLLNFHEKEVDPDTGELRTLRWLNGDETRSGKYAVMPAENPDYGGFPIAITIPARTGIATVEPYALTRS